MCKGKGKCERATIPGAVREGVATKEDNLLALGKKKDNGHISKDLTPRCNPNENDDTVIYGKPHTSAFFPLWHGFWR